MPTLIPFARRPSAMTALALGLLLAGCASLHAADAPGCSGPRRAANPHGSVLAPDAPATAAPSTAGASGCAGDAR